MAEENGDDDPYSFENFASGKSSEKADNDENLSDNLELDLGNRNHRKLDQIFDQDSTLSSYESPSRKEENPFSFKRFLNQDSSKHKNKGARKKVYLPVNSQSPNELNSSSNHNFNSSDLNSRLVNTPEMSSVLPDFVQDHLVIEQCYLSGSSPSIDIDNLNLQNLPDLNLEHRELDFSDRKRNDSGSSGSNMPDFTLNAGHYHPDNSLPNNKILPDFALNANNQILKTYENNPDELPDFTVNHRDRKNVQRSENLETSHTNRHRMHISSSPSVPLDLPSYDKNEPVQNSSNSLDGPIPFDLPIPAEERNSSSRGIPSSETVSKSLPDFLSDGPIRKKRLEENNQSVRGNLVSNLESNETNGLPTPEVSSPRTEQERLQREVELLRRQLTEKNRRIEILESEIQHMHTRDQTEAANLEYALQQVENNLRQTTKRAATAETTIQKLKQENRKLQSEVSLLRTENSELRLGNYSVSNPPSQEVKNHRIAKELRTAANAAESSLRSLLTGIENLRVIAASVENMHKFQDRTEDFKDFNYEDSASGPAL